MYFAGKPNLKHIAKFGYSASRDATVEKDTRTSPMNELTIQTNQFEAQSYPSVTVFVSQLNYSIFCIVFFLSIDIYTR